MAKSNKIKVGILINKPESIFSNGCFQQGLFVLQSLRLSDIYEPFLVTSKTGYDTFECSDSESITNLSTMDRKNELDILICVSGDILDTNGLNMLQKENIKMIQYNCGHLPTIWQEAMILGAHKNSGQLPEINRNLHKKYLWTIPNYTKYNDIIGAMLNAECRTIPYVWNTTIVDQWSKENKINLYCKPFDKSKPNFILIAEPNVNVTKTCLVPLLICDQLFASSKIESKVMVLCKSKHQAFDGFIDSLNFKAETYPRMPFFEVLKQLNEKNGNIIILSNHGDNPLNFMILEAMYLGYPVIHNSKPFQDGGYYYEKIKEAVSHIKNIINTHNPNGEYNFNAHKVISKFLPTTTLKGYENELNRIIIEL
tara:strand:+ start:1476 stop:2579 length:1104 start_codon:yes stop_codon:yes gene_type:complete